MIYFAQLTPLIKKKNPLFFYHVLSWHVQIKLPRWTFQIKLFSIEKPMYFSKNISLFSFLLLKNTSQCFLDKYTSFYQFCLTALEEMFSRFIYSPQHHGSFLCVSSLLVKLTALEFPAWTYRQSYHLFQLICLTNR